MIYLDNSATTKPYPEVIKTYAAVAEKYFANPSSIHQMGGEAERLVQEARKITAELLNVDPSEIIFTSGGTEADNLAVKGAAFHYQSRGKHLITTELEHPAVLNAFEQLKAFGFEITYLSAKQDGRVSIEELEKAIRPDTTLVSMIHVNNELGTIQPVEEAAELLSRYPTIQFHVDHVQGITKVPLNFKQNGIDMAAVSAHKFHGPRGVGLLYVRKGVQLMPLLSGGDQESGFRSGTENLPAVVAMAKALRLGKEAFSKHIERLSRLQAFLRKDLQDIDGIAINTPESHSAPHILNLSVSGVKPEVLVHALSEYGIYVSTKSACSSKEGGASPALLASGFSEEQAEHAIRISLSFGNNEREMKETVRAFKEIVPKLRKVGETT
ncbi:MAG TPA: cysteine desulfurase family protein [Bacillales bacterium]|nr:cysteine desulfurase family protein [Bacillales bacterium]